VPVARLRAVPLPPPLPQPQPRALVVATAGSCRQQCIFRKDNKCVPDAVPIAALDLAESGPGTGDQALPDEVGEAAAAAAALPLALRAEAARWVARAGASAAVRGGTRHRHKCADQWSAPEGAALLPCRCSRWTWRPRAISGLRSHLTSGTSRCSTLVTVYGPVYS
jgi:hypothetical protein